MTVRIYRSTDGSAPSLTGQAGALTTLLDAVLVNGYGALSAAGWTIGQTTTNKRQYVQGSGSTGFSLWVDDAASGTGGAKEARVAGYATMSATTPTGTGQFPTSSQSSIGTGMLVIRKSTTADGTARAWTIIADATVFYLFTETGDFTAPTGAFGFMFGDFFTYGATDLSNCAIIGRNAENTTATQSGGTLFDGFPLQNPLSATSLLSTLAGHYAAASFTNVGGSLALGKHSDLFKQGANLTSWGWNALGQAVSITTSGGQNLFSNMATPNGPDAGYFAAPVWLHHSGHVRGYLKGFWCPLQDRPLNHNDTFSGTGNLAGKSFVVQTCVIPFVTQSSAGGQLFMEYSDTWT